MADRRGHGFWPYWLPYVSFLVLVEIARRTPETWAFAMLAVKATLPGALLVYFFWRGAYPELRSGRPRRRDLALDFSVGVASAALWVGPYLAFSSLRPSGGEAFDPRQFGAHLAPLALGIRGLGYVLLTPFVEELFIRSWLLRYSHVFLRGDDFRDVPIGHFSWLSFLITGAAFTISHALWEYPVAILWFSLTTLWLLFRKQLWSVVVVHAVANASILAFVALADRRLLDGDGNPISLWFFL